MRYKSAQELPIFDTHIHYNGRDQDILSPEQVLAILDKAGVSRALVSSIPDDGTLMLYEKAPHRIVSFLRPYRTWKEMREWHSDPGVEAYVEERLRHEIYKGIGEIELIKNFKDTPVLKKLAEFVVQQQLFFHLDSDEVAVEKLLNLYPQVRVIWSTENRGSSASATTVGRLLAQFQNLWVEVSQRSSDVAPNGTLDPKWGSLFLCYPDRFVVGSASSGRKILLKFFCSLLHPNRFFKTVTNPWMTWVKLRWEIMVDETLATRGWLAQLPHDVAEKIAYDNAERLFGKS